MVPGQAAPLMEDGHCGLGAEFSHSRTPQLQRDKAEEMCLCPLWQAVNLNSGRAGPERRYIWSK